MAAKRIWITLALAVLFASTGCRTWCEHHYPCPQQACAQPCAPPCYPPAGYAPAVPAPTWSAPAAAPGPRCGQCVCP